jgi:signal transduction histidine kinase
MKGGNPLVGEVTIGGAKNAALGILAAAIMTDETVVIDNLPDVRDINVLLEAIREAGAVVERVAHMLQPLADAVNVELICDLQPGCLILCTQDDLYQVVFNLVENAIKYNLPHGRVTVTVQSRSDEVILNVSDTGVGIPEEDRPKIFDRFYRVDKARSRAAGGTGLGLAIVSETVKQHGGTIAVSPNENGVGSQFEVRFPAVKGGEE